MNFERVISLTILILLTVTGQGAVTSYGTPDVNLKVTSIAIDPPEPTIFQPITVTVTIENTGSEESGPFILELRWSCCEGVRKEVNSIGGGGITRVTLEKYLFFVDAGTYDLKAKADPDGAVAETNENDNEYSTTINVKLSPEAAHGREPSTARKWFEEPRIPIPWEENSLMLIGRKECGGQYYRDSEGKLLRELTAKPWDAANIHVNKMPYPDFTVRVNGLEVEIEDKSRDDDGEIVEWTFDFGDGTVETYNKDNPPPTPITHTYNPTSTPFTVNGTPAARYNIRLTVKDNEAGESFLVRSVYVGESGSKKLGNDDQPLPSFTISYGDGGSDYIFEGKEESTVKFDEWEWSIWTHEGSYHETFKGKKVEERFSRIHGRYCIILNVKNGSIMNFVMRDYIVDSIWLPTQRKNACGTTCLAYVLRYWGVDVMPWDVDEWIRDDSVVVMGTDPLAIADYAQMQGLDAQIYNNADLNFVRSLVRRGIPVMLNIIARPDTTDVIDGPGHWVVVISYGMVEGEPYIGFYEPNLGQIAVPEYVIDKYWKETTCKGVHLWTKLCIAIAPDSYELPPGDVENIRDKLALAYSIFQFMEGLDNFEEGNLLGGVVGLIGNLVLAVGSGITTIINVGLSYVPGMDFFTGFFGNIAGSILMSAGQIINDIAGVLDVKTLFTDPLEWLKNLGNLFLDIFESMGDFFEAVGEAIASFFEAIGDFFKDVGCALFGWGCPKEVVRWKHALSLDPCGETIVFINGFLKEKPVGYIFTEPPSNSVEIYLYGSKTPNTDGYSWHYYLVSGDVTDFLQAYVLMGFLGYSSETDPGGYVNLTKVARDADMYLGGVDGIPDYSLGFIPSVNCVNCDFAHKAVILWMMVSAGEKSIKIVSTDPCLYTRTFLFSPLKGYSRDMVLGYVFNNEAPGTVPLYRFYNPDTEDYYSSTNPEPEDGYLLTGIVGYIYPTNAPKPPGTVALYSFWNEKSRDHMESTDMYAEGKEGYELVGIVGYIFESHRPCTIPLWRYCLRYVTKE